MVESETIRRIPLFRGLSAGAVRELAARATVRTFEPGAVLWLAGTEPRGLFVVLEGEVRVVRPSGQRQHVIHSEGPGGTLGDVPLFAGGGYPATAVASRRSSCLVVDRQAIAAAMREDPEIGFRLLARLAGRVRHLIGRLGGLAGQSVTERLAGWLLERHGASSAGSFTLGCTQAALAEELGTAREVVVRSLRDLREAGVIRAPSRGRFEVADEAALRALAGAGRAR